MVQVSQHACLALKACQPVGILRKGRGQDLDGDLAIEFGITCPIDFTHSTHTQQRKNLIPPKLTSNQGPGKIFRHPRGHCFNCWPFQEAPCLWVRGQQRFQFLAKLFVVTTGLLEKLQAGVGFQLPRLLAELLNLLPPFRFHFSSYCLPQLPAQPAAQRTPFAPKRQLARTVPALGVVTVGKRSRPGCAASTGLARRKIATVLPSSLFSYQSIRM